MSTTGTTRKPSKSKAKPSSSPWNTEKPEFNPFQLDPSLLHNGFLFDKRQMQTEMDQKSQKSQKSAAARPIATTTRPIFRSSPTQKAYSYHQSTTFRPKIGTPVGGFKKNINQAITFKPRLTTTSTT